MNILIFAIILLVLVIVHELGHFFAAKFFGIRVDEFGFGFPPRIASFQKGETRYSFNLLPIGGFVKIFGENPDEENTNGPDKARSFVHKAKWKQAIVLFAGVFMNFLLAWVLFSYGFMSGFPTAVGSEAPGYVLSDVNLVVISVADKSPAQAAGLKSGDKILFVGEAAGDLGIPDANTKLNPETLKSFVMSHPDGVSITYTRGKSEELQFLKIVPEAAEGSQPKIGISMDQIGIAKLPFFSAIGEGWRMNWYTTKNTAIGLYSLIVDGIRGKGSFATVTGPVGMVGIVGDAYQFGFAYLLSFAALISINLAIINLIPFPALDGGRLFFLMIEKIKRSPLNPKVVNTANMIGFAILILLMVVVTYHDIAKLL